MNEAGKGVTVTAPGSALPLTSGCEEVEHRRLRGRHDAGSVPWRCGLSFLPPSALAPSTLHLSFPRIQDSELCVSRFLTHTRVCVHMYTHGSLTCFSQEKKNGLTHAVSNLSATQTRTRSGPQSRPSGAKAAVTASGPEAGEAPSSGASVVTGRR